MPKGDGRWATVAEVRPAARRHGYDCRKMLFETAAKFCVLPVFGPGCPPWDDRGCALRMVGTVNGACAHWVCQKLPAKSRGYRRRSSTTSTTAATPRPARLPARPSSPWPPPPPWRSDRRRRRCGRQASSRRSRPIIIIDFILQPQIINHMTAAPGRHYASRQTRT